MCKCLKDRPIFLTDLQIRTMFGLGWVGGFTETGCSDFKGNEKSVHPEIPYCLSISSHCSFILRFCLLPISEIFPLVNFLSWINFMDKWKFKGIQIFLVANIRIKGWVGGSAVIRTLFGFVNPYEILDNRLIEKSFYLLSTNCF